MNPSSFKTSKPARPSTKFYTVGDVAECLGVSERTVRRWIDSGAVAVHRLGRLTRISDADLEAFLAAHRSGRLMSGAGR